MAVSVELVTGGGEPGDHWCRQYRRRVDRGAIVLGINTATDVPLAGPPDPSAGTGWHTCLCYRDFPSMDLLHQ